MTEFWGQNLENLGLVRTCEVAITQGLEQEAGA